jgi:hypothetical protein
MSGNFPGVSDPLTGQWRTSIRTAGGRVIRITSGVLERARRIDREHRRMHDHPASAATLRRLLRIGSPESNYLVKVIRGQLSPPEFSAASGSTAAVV